MAATPAVIPEGAEVATLAAGCFWGVEHLYVKNFGHGKGLLDTRVGYIGGATDSPTYKIVCSGATGHAEATQLIFDPKIVSYRDLLLFFYRMHDPTQLNRQGPDVGTQYRSAIFYNSPEQEAIAREVTEAVGKKWWTGGKIATEIVKAGRWYDAEEYHQLYLDRNPGGYECPSHFVRDFPPL
ncbi:putative peptide methionine sulfoxide reductase [Scedosporium apiospermum]|uniref:peptide-methionine (S)-S-oxide reductase n=1 Tax=Pseudallescheria apiosperma TaxID=563466 RepID=A0A084GEY6_PSEDA|nr:putative peptide methionine sulfoxide reductase [Scedosporium apiospermum]KEZ45898.1 putative peptide methionine sulfoxide reductase [Scedosporium apiospermum]